MKKLILAFLLLPLACIAQTNKTPLLRPILQTSMDGNGQSITNVGAMKVTSLLVGGSPVVTNGQSGVGLGGYTISGLQNLIPANATYNTHDANFNPAYQMPFNLTNGVVYLVVSGESGHAMSDNSGVYNFPEGQIAELFPKMGVFTNTSDIIQPMFVSDNIGDFIGMAVDVKLYALPSGQYASNIVSGTFTGTFQGGGDLTLSSNSVAPRAALPNTVLYSTSPGRFLSTNLFSHGLDVYSSSKIPTGDGTTLGLWKFGINGYCDIGFFVDNQNTSHPIGDARRYNLHGALGAGVEGTNQFPYTEPYWENFGQHSFWFVQYGSWIFGGVNGTNGDFKWYSNRQSDADETTCFFDLDRSTATVRMKAAVVTNNFIVSGTNFGSYIVASNSIYSPYFYGQGYGLTNLNFRNLSTNGCVDGNTLIVSGGNIIAWSQMAPSNLSTNGSSSGQVLTSSGGVTAWATPAAGYSDAQAQAAVGMTNGNGYTITNLNPYTFGGFQDIAFIPITNFLNGWVNWDTFQTATNELASVYRQGNRTWIQGTLRNPSGSGYVSSMFALPWGYRPSRYTRLAPSAYNGSAIISGSVNFNIDGNTSPEVSVLSGNGFLALSGAIVTPQYFDAYTNRFSTNTFVLVPPHCPPKTSLIVYTHGVGEDEFAPVMDALKQANIQALLATNCIIISHLAHGNNWGNLASQSDYTNAVAWASTQAIITNTMILSQSMGGLDGLDLMARFTNFSRWYGIYPVCNLGWMYTNNGGGFQTQITNAFGFTTAGGFAAATVNCDPMTFATNLYGGKRYRVTSSLSDTVVDATNNSIAFTNLVKWSTRLVTTGNHGDASNFNTNDMLSFLFGP